MKRFLSFTLAAFLLTACSPIMADDRFLNLDVSPAMPPHFIPAVLTDPIPATTPAPAPQVVIQPLVLPQVDIPPGLNAQQQAVLQNVSGWLAVAKALALPITAALGWLISEVLNAKARLNRQGQQLNQVALATPPPSNAPAPVTTQP